MNCRVCGKKTEFAFEEIILKNKKISYFLCDACDFLQTEDPHWLNEAYSDALVDIDTGVLHRNSFFAGLIYSLFYFKKGPFLDYAGGYGVFSRFMRDFGKNFYWQDKYAENLLSKGFESNEKDNKKFEAITCFECFEHFVNPLSELKNLLKKTDYLVISTQLKPQKIPKTDWWYYSFDSGQHISFYGIKTLNYLAKESGCSLTSFRNIHIFSKKKVSKFKLIIAFILGISRSIFLLYLFMNHSMKDRERLLKK